MKKIYLLVTAVFLLASCAKETLPNAHLEQGQKQEVIERIDFNELPSDLLNRYDLSHATPSGKSVFFGEINENAKINKITTNTGKSSYTFSLKRNKDQSIHKNPAGYYFDNLVIWDGKELKSFILRYEPTQEWLENGRDYGNFSGKITTFNHLGEAQSSFNTSKEISEETH